MRSYEESKVEENVSEVEAIVDRIGVGGLVELVAMVCELKVDHIEHYWQDHSLADSWKRNQKLLERVYKCLSN